MKGEVDDNRIPSSFRFSTDVNSCRLLTIFFWTYIFTCSGVLLITFLLLLFHSFSFLYFPLLTLMLFNFTLINVLPFWRLHVSLFLSFDSACFIRRCLFSLRLMAFYAIFEWLAAAAACGYDMDWKRTCVS